MSDRKDTITVTNPTRDPVRNSQASDSAPLYAGGMSETPDTKPSAMELNQRIRALLLRSGGRLSGEQRAEYQLLLSRWAEAVREDIVAAA